MSAFERSPGVPRPTPPSPPPGRLKAAAAPAAADTDALLAAFGRGVAAPSANRFGSVSATTATHVVTDLGDAVDYILDGGAEAVGPMAIHEPVNPLEQRL